MVTCSAGWRSSNAKLVHVEKPASSGFIDQVTCEQCGMSYSRSVPESTDETVAFLLLDREKQAVIGACRFRWPESPQDEPVVGNAMDFWIAPTHRRHGVPDAALADLHRKFQALRRQRPLATPCRRSWITSAILAKQATAELAPRPIAPSLPNTVGHVADIRVRTVRVHTTLSVGLRDGRTISVPLAWHPRRSLSNEATNGTGGDGWSAAPDLPPQAARIRAS